MTMAGGRRGGVQIDTGRWRRYPRRPGRAVHFLWQAASLCVLTAAVCGALAALLAAGSGYRLVVIMSGSMTPAIPVGTLVVSHAVLPGTLSRGDVVTFHDPAMNGAFVTHRVVAVTREASRFVVVTRGDANRLGETWPIPASGSLGKAELVVPWVGWWFGILGSAGGRVAVVIGLCLWAAGAVLSRVWSMP